MNIIDILVCIVLVFALWQGWSSGILVQLGGIIGIVAGIWVAYKFWKQIARWFEVDTSYSWIIFIAVLLSVLLTVIILLRLVTRLLKAGGLSAPLRILGAVFSVAKTVIILSLLLTAFEYINAGNRLTDGALLNDSVSYEALKNISEFIFPYLTEFTSAAKSLLHL